MSIPAPHAEGREGDDGLLAKRVVLVEDDFFIAMGAVTALTRAGLEVLGPYGTLAQGLQAVMTETFDFAILDINLRGDRSYEIADELAARAIPFVFATGYEDTDWSSPAPKIIKPYTNSNLLTALRTLL